ncbi:hypothetical protein ACRWQN_14605 [Shewanella sp. HL-SH8]|uniref:hypothetical protein n=1 Tax=Shewanella sp. HL-SH8 TaxID=3436242 RepID=UPI003EBE62E5
MLRQPISKALYGKVIMWESFDPNDWESLPHLSGRVATEDDVKNGVAVFYIPEGSFALNAMLPTCVIQIDEETGERTPAVVIQAEQAGEQVYLGLRYLTGGNGICGLDEVEQLEEPNEEFAI